MSDWFFRATKPEDPEIGDTWYDAENNTLCTYDGTGVKTLLYPPEWRNVPTEEQKREKYIRQLIKEGFTKEDAEIMYTLSLEE